jgi:hypothetical protein
VCGLVLAAASPVPASAQPASTAAELPPPDKPAEGQVALVYVLGKGTAGCPDEATFRDWNQAFFDFVDPFVPSGTAAPARVRITISRDAAGYRGVHSVLQEGRQPTESVAHHKDCDALVWTLAHWMTLVIARKPMPPPTACPACPACEACPAPKPCPLPEAPKELPCDAACVKKKADELCRKYGHCPNMGPTLTIMGGGLITAGWASNVGPGAYLGGEVKWEVFSIGIEARATFPEEAQRYYKSPPTSDLYSFSGLLVPCARWKWLFGCGFVEVGQFTFTVPNDPKGDARELLFALGPRGGVDVPLPEGFSLRAFADFAIHPYAPREDVTDLSDPAHKVRPWDFPWVSGFFGLGIAWSK